MIPHTYPPTWRRIMAHARYNTRVTYAYENRTVTARDDAGNVLAAWTYTDDPPAPVLRVDTGAHFQAHHETAAP